MLLIDVGNTKIAVGLVQNGKLIQTWKISSRTERTSDEYKIHINALLAKYGTSLSNEQTVLVSSVVPHISREIVQAHDNVILINHQTKLSYKIAIEQPESLGADRIADAEGAVALFGTPVLIVDLGTASTISVVNDKKEFLGGIITTGIGLSSQTLFRQTAALREVALEIPQKVIGHNTTTAIQSGICLGHACMMQGLIDLCRKELQQPDAKVILTGGALSLLSPLFPPSYHVEPSLTLKGMLSIAKNLSLEGTYV